MQQLAFDSAHGIHTYICSYTMQYASFFIAIINSDEALFVLYKLTHAHIHTHTRTPKLANAKPFRCVFRYIFCAAFLWHFSSFYLTLFFFFFIENRTQMLLPAAAGCCLPHVLHLAHTHTPSAYLRVSISVSLLAAMRRIQCLLVTDINVPQIVDFRDNVTLSCSYDISGHTLNSVKWYKNDGEFFR